MCSQKTKIKKNLREFSGFPDKGDAEKKKAMASKFDSKLLKKLLETCDLGQGGTKAECVDRLTEFLSEPSASGKKSLVEKVGEKRMRAEKKKELKEKKAAKKVKEKEKKEKAKAKAAKPAGKAKKGAGELKRPLTAFMLYSQAKRDKVRAENPEASMG